VDTLNWLEKTFNHFTDKLLIERLKMSDRFAADFMELLIDFFTLYQWEICKRNDTYG
jgi:hypothetical protein